MKYETIIIGAGIIGTSTAYHLHQQTKKPILLLEKNSKVAAGNTRRSAALYRNLFSSDTSQALATSSIAFYETIAKAIGLRNPGYLWLFSAENWRASKKALRKLEQVTDSIELLPVEQIKKQLFLRETSSEKLPEISRALYARRCGSLSAIKLTNYYTKKFIQSGGKIVFNTEITKLLLSHKEDNFPPWEKVKLLAVEDQHGTTYTADKFVFATGAWTDRLLTPIGIASQIYPKKRQMFTLKIKDPHQFVNKNDGKVPIVILPSGVYIKPALKNHLLLVGCANELGNPYSMNGFPPAAEEEYFKKVIKPVLQHYFPRLRGYQLFSQWAGYYAYYWPDKNPVIEQVSNIFWISGTSGSGIMKADAIGRIAAGRILGKERVVLFDGSHFPVRALSLKKRQVDVEEFII